MWTSWRPTSRNRFAAYSSISASAFVPAMRPQYLTPSSRDLREIAVMSLTNVFIRAPSSAAYF
jgi:hypothetical protein